MDDEGAVAPVATAAGAALAVGSGCCEPADAAAVDGAAKLSNSGIPVENMMMDVHDSRGQLNWRISARARALRAASCEL
jgi:hypothetical protein